MKQRTWKIFALIAIISIAVPVTAHAQEKISIPALVQEKNFVFVAETVSPMAGRTRSLSSMYDLRIMNDSLVVDLPYFGRAYSATYSMAGGGIDFTSTDFTYTVEKKKKDRYLITISPSDTRDVRELTLTVFNNGRADLRVTSDNRQSIGFTGYVEPLKD